MSAEFGMFASREIMGKDNFDECMELKMIIYFGIFGLITNSHQCNKQTMENGLHLVVDRFANTALITIFDHNHY